MKLPTPPTAAKAPVTPIPVVAYVRSATTLSSSTTAEGLVAKSTEHHNPWIEKQLDCIRKYAARRNMEIIEVFTDAGKSGFKVKGGESLQRMVATVESGNASFQCILTYDINRWGRSQDSDESGYYESVCKRAGITVHYCAEYHSRCGSPTSNIIASVKRAMAGEYSRELSSKVRQGARRLIQHGSKPR